MSLVEGGYRRIVIHQQSQPNYRDDATEKHLELVGFHKLEPRGTTALHSAMAALTHYPPQLDGLLVRLAGD